MDQIYIRTGQELYDYARLFKLNNEIDEYATCLTSAANYGYQKAIETIFDDELFKQQNYNNTLQFYLETAYDSKLPNSFSIHFLANMYQHGLAVQADINKAISLYKLAIKKNNYYSMHTLATIYINQGIKINKVIKLYERAITFEYVPSMLELANMYFDGTHVATDYVKAKKMYKSIISILPQSSVILVEIIDRVATMYYHGMGGKQNYVKAKKLYKQAVNKLYLRSMYPLATIYHNGLCGKYKYDKAKNLYKVTIKESCLKSISALGILYQYESNYTKANELFEIASKRGCGYSLNSLGINYARGNGVEADLVKAVELYKLAVEAENADAALNLASMYFYGKGVESSYSKYMEMLHLSVKFGGCKAAKKLAYIYRCGNIWHNVSKNQKEAIKFYEIAISRGSIKAIMELADMYMGFSDGLVELLFDFLPSSWSTEQNYTKVIGLYEKAVEQQSLKSIVPLAKMYEKGLGVEKNYDKAIELCKIGAKNSHAASIKKLISLLKKAYAKRIDDCIEILAEVNLLDYLWHIYDFDCFTINIIKEKCLLKHKVAELEISDKK